MSEVPVISRRRPRPCWLHTESRMAATPLGPSWLRPVDGTPSRGRTCTCNGRPDALRRSRPSISAVSAQAQGVSKAPSAGSVSGTTSKTTLTKPRRATFGRLWENTKPEAGRLALGALGLLVSSGTNLSYAYIMGKVIDRTAGRPTAGGTGDRISRLSNKVFYSGVLGVFVLGSLGSWVRVYNLGVATHRMAKRLRMAIFSSLLKQELAFFDEQRTGELVAVLTEDVDIAAQTCTDRLASGLRSLNSAVNGTILLLSISPRLMFLSLSVVPIVGASAMTYSRHVKKLTNRMRDLMGKATGFAEERIANIRTVRLFAQEKGECEAYMVLNDGAWELSRQIAAAQGAFMGGLSSTIGSSLVMVLYFGGTLVGKGHMTVGNLTSFALYSSMVGVGFSGLSSFYGEFTKGLASAERVFELVDRQPQLPVDKGEVLATVRGDVTFRDVWFQYPSRHKAVLTGLNLELKQGEVLALTGASGSGKSTVAALLTSLYAPDRGQVLLDGVDVATLNPTWLRGQIGVVDQDPVLFAGTIADNIRYGLPDATMADVRRAATEANAHDFIESFPQRYDTFVGEQGRQLSGGQKQRIAIARAVLKNPPALILDEATSSLDRESEVVVQDAVDSLMKGRSVLVITHKPASIEKAHRVAVLDGGRVVEVGKPAELLSSASSALRLLMAGDQGTQG